MFSLTLPGFALPNFWTWLQGQTITVSKNLGGFAFAQLDTIKAPETFEEAKEVGERAIIIGIKELPGIMVTTFKEKVLPVWKDMYDWFDINIWSQVKPLIWQEVERRKEVVKEEFEEEKQEMKEDIPRVGRSLWERFKELWE